MSNVLARIQELIKRASAEHKPDDTHSEKEARNAAVMACKLIIANNVTLSMPVTAASREAPGSVSNQKPQRPTEDVNEVMRNGSPVDLGDLSDFFRSWDRTVKRVEEVRDRDEPPYVITAPQDGFCRDCGENYQRGQQIWYRRGVGAVHHMKCDPDKLKPVRPQRR